MVPKHSAIVFGATNSEAVPLVANHKTMAKFTLFDDPNFQKIAKRLQVFNKDAADKVSWNWRFWDKEKGMLYQKSEEFD